jgi:hypothetical protein
MPVSAVELAARVDQLEAETAELRKLLARRGTMKQTLRCACGGTSILEFTQVYEFGRTDVEAFALQPRVGFWGNDHIAPLAAFACEACGYVEWHVKTFENVQVDGRRVIRHQMPAEPPRTDEPYR